MSKYLLHSDVVFKNRDLLLGALADVGYAQVDQGEALPLYGYHGDRRPETAELVVRRRHLGHLSNDLGFRRTDAGYVPIVSEFDQRVLLQGQLLPKLRTAYNERVVETVRGRLRGSLRRTVEGSLVKLRVRY